MSMESLGFRNTVAQELDPVRAEALTQAVASHGQNEPADSPDLVVTRAQTYYNFLTGVSEQQARNEDDPGRRDE